MPAAEIIISISNASFRDNSILEGLLHTTRQKGSHKVVPFFKIVHRDHTEIGKQNSKTFPELFKDFLHFFQDAFPLQAHCFYVISAVVSSHFFLFCLSRFLLCKVSLLVACDLY